MVAVEVTTYIPTSAGAEIVIENVLALLSHVIQAGCKIPEPFFVKS